MTCQCIDDHTGTTLCLGVELCSHEDDARRSRHEWMMVRLHRSTIAHRHVEFCTRAW